MSKHQAYRIIENRIVHDVIDGETVMINLENGNYYLLNNTGSMIWTLLQQPVTVEAVVSAVALSYGEQEDVISTQVQPFFMHLLEEGLCATVPAQAITSLNMTSNGMPYEAPKLTVFTDMQELLLLDPVHETDERGWPHRAKTESVN